MRHTAILFLCASFMMAGCDTDDSAKSDAKDKPAAGDGNGDGNGKSSEDPNATKDDGNGEPAVDEGKLPEDPGVAKDDGKVDPVAEERQTPQETTALALTPDNTTIQFVGKHVDKSREDRTGTFGEFSGQLGVDLAAKTLTMVSVEIQAASLSTGIDKLTNHLKSPDFFDVRENPTVRFQSTSIEAADDRQFLVTGELTLLGTTKEISFPATLDVTTDGVKLTSDFTIDRTDFGMNFGPSMVENEISLTISVDAAGL